MLLEMENFIGATVLARCVGPQPVFSGCEGVAALFLKK